MKNDLVERYIYAVTRHLPLKIRADVEQELDSLIADMLAERCGDILPTDKDVRIVLIELGTPEELAAKYIGENGDENHALISGSYFLVYKRILKIVLPIAAAAILFANILELCLAWDAMLNPYILFGKAIGQSIGGALGGAGAAFAIITIVFAILERKKVVFNDEDMFSHLSPVPKMNERIKPYEPICSMIFCIIVAVIFLGFPQIAGGWLDGAGWVPIFVPSVIRGLWIFIVLWAILGIVRESVKLMDGQYTKRLVVVTIICNILTAISVAIVFLDGGIMNPEFVNQIGIILGGENDAIVLGVFANFNLFFLGVVFLALIIDAAIVSIKTLKYGKN